LRNLILTALVGAMVTACGDSGGINPKGIPQIAVTEGQQVVAPNSTLSTRADLPARVQVANTGTDVLMIKAIVVESTPAGAFSIVSLPTASEAAPIELFPETLAHQFAIAYDPSVVRGDARPTGIVRIRTNSTLNSAAEFVFNVVAEVTFARLIVTPPIIDFGEVAMSTTSTKSANLLNTGGAALAIERIVFSGHVAYTATIAGVDYTVTDESAAGGIVLDPPLSVPASSALNIDVKYAAIGEEAAKASLVFFTDDATSSAGSELKLFANVDGPCIKAYPARVSFGGRLVDEEATFQLELQSCGGMDLVISDLALIADGNGVFAVKKDALGTFPVTIPAGASVGLPVTYKPSVIAELGVDGQYVLEQGEIEVVSNGYLAVLEVPVDGFGTDGNCPVAKITVEEGDEVLPQTKLHLSGFESTAAQGLIQSYEWSVVQPTGSVSTFIPSERSADPTFETNIVGTYIFRLSVRDSAGTKSCSPATYTVNTTSDDAIRVELLWRTPGDSDETDAGGDTVTFSVGSDLDLHFLHKSAFGKYFERVYDCYWDEKNPEWGTFGPSDNPRLDRDDTDGGGPENLNMAVPEQNLRYQAGVHYWNDWGYGNAFATVRVYVYNVLRDQWNDVELKTDDLWDTHTIDWPSGNVTRIGGGTTPRITPDYRNLGANP